MMNCSCQMVDWQKWVKPPFQSGPLSKVPIIANLWYTASWIGTCEEPEVSLSSEFTSQYHAHVRKTDRTNN